MNASGCPRCGGPRTTSDGGMTLRCAYCAVDPAVRMEWNIKRSPEVWDAVIALVSHWDAIRSPADEIIWTETERLTDKLATAAKRDLT